MKKSHLAREKKVTGGVSGSARKSGVWLVATTTTKA